MRICEMCCHATMERNYEVVYRGKRLISSGTREYRECDIFNEVVKYCGFDDRAETCEHFEEWKDWQKRIRQAGD